MFAYHIYLLNVQLQQWTISEHAVAIDAVFMSIIEFHNGISVFRSIL